MGHQWTVPATVKRVVDGDTVDLLLDLGWHITYESRCRVSGINAPEMNTAEGRAAKTYADSLLGVNAEVIFTSKSLDKYGRPLGVIILDRGSFAQLMLDAGHAVLYP